MTQTRLARSISELRGIRVSQQAINDIERGIVRNPRALLELAQVLQTTPAVLLGKSIPAIDPTEPYFPLYLWAPLDKAPNFPANVLLLNSQLFIKPTRHRDIWLAELGGKSSMSPAYDPGDWLLLDPSKNPRLGDDCFFMSGPVPQIGVAAKLAKLLKVNPKNWRVQSSYLPKKEETLSRKRFPRAVVVIGAYNAGHGRDAH
jgi:hypothetical protein